MRAILHFFWVNYADFGENEKYEEKKPTICF